MNVGLVMLVSLGLLALSYRFYARRVAQWLGVDPSRKTPAHEVNDGVDYVPTKPLVLFGHHYASIAAAGPIIGPTLAALYGIVPVWLWIVLGVIFIGAVHDFTALFVSLRQGGKSVAEVARTALGPFGFVLYVAFAILLCLLVSAAFLNIAVEALTSHYPLSALNLQPTQTVFRTIEVPTTVNGQQVLETHALTGGIATVSVIVITLGAPLIGWLLYRRGASAWVASVVAIILCAFSFVIGFAYQLRIDPSAVVLTAGGLSLTTAHVVLLILLAYCFVAGWVPVWLVLQPRDFVNVHVLFFGLATMTLGLLACGIQGVTINAPPANLAEGGAKLGMLWPFLFVTIACGACSGAHGLICGGTTCKQLDNEKNAPAIGYGAMLLEAVLGLCVALMIVGPMGFEQYRSVVWPAGDNASAFAVKGFALAVGMTLNTGFGMPIYYGTIFGIILLEGFVLTTTDTIIRLCRYLLEELWFTAFKSVPAWLSYRVVNTGIVILIVAWLAFSNSYGVIWPIFGAANQLLAALTLVAATAWLLQKAKKAWFVAIPALFMATTTIVSLILLFQRYVTGGKWTLTVVDALLIAMAAGVVVMTIRRISQLNREIRTGKYAVP
jgi:carbon starvation protein